MTMDEHKSPEATPLVELIEQVLQGTASDEQKQQLQARLLANPEDRRVYLHRLNLHSVLRRQLAYDVEGETPAQLDLPSTGRDSENASRRPTPRLGRWAWAAVAATVAVLIATLYLQRPSAERPIAKITGLSGSLQWTGDGGRVFNDLSVGAELLGGTVEGMTPGSWFELEFIDGSTVMISGNSMLTFSDHGQKTLNLKAGNVSGNVKPQPAGKPMLIYTRAAMLEIVGTQFEVEAGLAATMLNVSEGTVRVKRFSDGSTVDVPAKHRVIAAADRKLSPVPVPDSVSRWKSQLHLGPDGTQGKWSPGTDEENARLGAIPYTTSQGKTIYTAAFGVSRGDKPPVILQPTSRFRVRGRIASAHAVYFGVTVRHLNGEFAGNFQTIRPAMEFRNGRDFEVVLDLQDFRLDPSLLEMKSKLPSVPFHLVVESMWCHTLYEPAGLEIVEVELLPPTTSAISQSPTTEPRQLPVMDIWTAAARGNLEVVKRHLAAGAQVDATFTAPGIPASGATPLHLAVLADQGAVAKFLIQKGANLNARAKDEHGGTPLHWAAALGRVEMARRLMEAGADVNARDNNGFTPLDATNYNPEFEKEAKREIAGLLRKKGANRAMENQRELAPPRR
jgi:ferric-dicitrate binding protein FerR (iron transport regulator)